MLQVDMIRHVVFVCMLLHTGRATGQQSFYDPNFSCELWDSYTAENFVSMASGSRIGENMCVCNIVQGEINDACRWYVKYNINGYYIERMGLSFQGEPGGDGCCSSVSDCSTALGAGLWLKDICCGPVGWVDIGYNFLIGGNDSYVYVGRGWDNEGAHTRGYNNRSIGIAIIGNYHQTRPHDDILDTLEGLMKCGVERGMVKEDYVSCGHREFKERYTDCPGDNLRNLVNDWDRCDRL